MSAPRHRRTNPKAAGREPKDICDYWRSIESAAALMTDDGEEEMAGSHIARGDGAAGKTLF